MNNRKDFLEWMKNKKEIAFNESRKYLWQLDALNNVNKIFSITSADGLSDDSTPEITLYAEFLNERFPKPKSNAEELASNNNHQVIDPKDIVFDESIFEVNKPENDDKETDYELFKDYIVTDSEKMALDGDYFKKKKAYHRLKKMSFHLLSETYATAFVASQLQFNEPEPICKQTEPASLVFDVVSSQVADLGNNEINDMTSYVSYSTEQKEKKYIRSRRAFYYSHNIPKQESAASAFLNRNPSMDVIQRSIRDTIASQKSLAVGTKMICLVPDNLGDFRDTIKSQIRSSSSNLIQIPRSIATVYSFAKQYELEQDTSFVCYDYNSSDLCRTEIRVHYNEETDQHEFTRMRRQIMRSGQHYNFNKVANCYLSAYADKYQVSIPQSAIRMLIETRDILKIIARGQSVPIEVNDDLINIDYDRSIVDNIATAIMDEVNHDDFEADYCCALLDLNTSVNGFCGFGYLLKGCCEIQERIKRHEDIWTEYLPELSLEVIRDGTFDNLKLIDKGMVQKISESTMEEEVEIPLKDGRFSLPIGKGKVFCPLVREEYGNRQRDKMAMFDNDQIGKLTKVFGKDVTAVQVDLTLTYHYGDPDSYRLTASPCEVSDVQIQSQWCDEEDQIMDNSIYPEYTPQSITAKGVDFEDVINRFYENIEKDWLFQQDGVRGNAPFDKNRIWYVVSPITYSIVSIQSLFSPQNISKVSPFVVTKMENVIVQLLGLLDDAENDCLNYGDCDFDGKQIQSVKDSILNVLSMLGEVCHNGNQELYGKLVKAVLATKSYYHSRYLFQLSTFASREKDLAGIWSAIDDYLPKERYLEVAVRALGSVCWRNPNWIYSFGKCDEEIIKAVVAKTISYCKSEFKKIETGYNNPRSIRDGLEALLGLSRLKESSAIVVEMLNCNSANIKEFVVFLKELDREMSKKSTHLKYPFNSRLDIVVPKELSKTSSVVYPLIALLTGGNAIKLTGFTED